MEGPNNIALIYLENAVEAKPLALCSENYFGRPLAACGMSEPGIFMEAKAAEEQVHDPARKGIIRTLEKDGEIFCQGNYGGPLYPLDEVSRTPLCLYGVYMGLGFCDELGVYVRVSEKIDWILYNMGLAVKLKDRNELFQFQ